MNDTPDQTIVTAANPATATHERRPKVVPYAHRWWIDCEFVVTTPLAVGNGGQQTGRLPPPKESKKLPQVNTVAFNTRREPYVPATGLKGALRALSDAVQPGMTALLFGAEPIAADGSPVRKPGFVDVHDAHALLEPPQGANPEYTRATVIETSTRIDRDRGTVADRALFNDERVEAGTRFKASFFVQCPDKAGGETVAAQLLGLFNAANDTGGLALGADTGRGFGRVQLASPTVKYFGSNELARWQANGFGGTWISAASVVKDIAANKLNAFSASNGETRLTFDIQFSSLFLVNDPERTSTGENAIAHAARIDASGKPVLPARSLQGALRSQSERILRTLGIACCGAGGEACCDKKITKREEFCLACQLYGNTQLASRLTQPLPPSCQKTGVEHTQDFIAIDRFTGGGKDGAKFNAKGFYQPAFRATLALANDVSDAAKGLLLLTLRDLAEGDIPLGWGKRKGYGECTIASKPGKPFVECAALALTGNAAGENALRALRALPRSHARNSSLPESLESLFTAPDKANATTAQVAKVNPEATTKSTKPIGIADRFHNTYHFIPIEAADLPKWAKVDDFKVAKKWATEEGIGIHSHARYAAGTDAAPVFSGRVECTLTAETPFIVGGTRTKNTDGSNTVLPYAIDKKLTIPASTLKGLIGSIAEAASGSAMRVMDTTSIISFRKPVSAALTSVGYVFRDDTGVLRVNPLSEGDHYARIDPKTVTPVAGKQLRIRALSPPISGLVRDVVASKFREIQVHALPPSLVKPTTLSIAPRALSSFEKIADQRTLASLGDAHKSDALADTDPSFKALAGSVTPYHLITCVMSHPDGKWGRALGWTKRNGDVQPKNLFEQLKLRPQAGDTIYYRANGKTIVELSYSRVWRGLVLHGESAASYADFLPHPEFRPFAAHRTVLTFAELLLGFVQDDGKPVDANAPQALAFAGKLRFHDAQLRTEKYTQNPVALKLLASPKPPSPSLYFTGTSGARYIRKGELADDKHRLRGRKQYLHALGVAAGKVAPLEESGNAATAPTQGALPWLMTPLAPNIADPHAKQRTHASLISEGASCDFAIDFDNITLQELQLLAFSVRPAESFRHKLGMGKGIGLGTVRLDPTAVWLVDRLRRYGTDGLTAQRNGAEIERQQLANLASSWRESQNAASAKIALLAIGNPANVKYPVHVPQTKGLSIEKETFGWFVDNDCEPLSEPHQTLGDITDAVAELPTLLRYPKRTQR